LVLNWDCITGANTEIIEQIAVCTNKSVYIIYTYTNSVAISIVFETYTVYNP